MRILLAHNNYTVTGGAEVFYHEVGRVLEESGHKVAYFSCQEDELDTPWAEYFPPARSYSSGGVMSRALGVPAIIYNRKAKAQMARLISDFKPDVIHAFAIYVRLTPSILDAAREAGVPVVLSCNDYKHICPNYKLYHHGHICEECKGGRFHRALVNRCCHGSLAISAASMVEGYAHSKMDIWRRNVSCFLFASEFMAKKTEEFWGRDSFRYDMLSNPFDAGKFRLDGKIGDYVLFFGRLIDEKGVDVLLEAAALVPDLPVIIIGEGPDRVALEQQAEKAGLSHVRFVGPKWGDDLNNWLKDARAVVVPSVWHENFPYVIFQAFAAAKPVLGSNRGGIPELVKDARGWIYDPLNVDSLAEGLRHVRDLPSTEISEMGAAAQKFVADEFNDAAIYSKLIKIYKRVTT